jgi:uncharacterized membrane protein YhdT
LPAKSCGGTEMATFLVTLIFILVVVTIVTIIYDSFKIDQHGHDDENDKR